MSLEINIRNALTRIATEFKAVKAREGELPSLQTTAKTSLVAAINELRQLIASASPSVTLADVDTRIQALIASAPTTLDTLQELANALGNDPSFSATITAALGNRIRFDAEQTLTAAQRTQALANLGAAPTTHHHDSQYYTIAQLGDITADFTKIGRASCRERV